MSSKIIEKRLQAIDDVAIPHRQEKFVAAELEGLYLRGVRKKQAQCMTLTGPSGAGKTWALERFMDQRNAEAVSDDHAEADHLPVVYVTAPNSASEKALAAKILRRLGDPAAEKGTSDSLAERLRWRVETLGTRMIIIDEAHHLVDVRLANTAKIRQTAEWMKNLLFDSRCVYVYAGLPTTDQLVKTNEQLARRCRTSVSLDGLSFQSRKQKKFFVKVVDTFIEATGLPLDIPDPDIYRAIHRATDGALGGLALLFGQAVEEAHKLDLDGINGDCLANAWTFTPLREMSPNTKELTHNPFSQFAYKKR